MPSRTISLGVLLLLAILLADVLVAFLPRHPYGESLLIGLSFGQMGLALLWATCEDKLKAWRIAICYLVTGIAATHFVVVGGGPRHSIAATAFILVLRGTYTTLVLGAYFVVRWIRFTYGSNSQARSAPPRFGMRHLLLATVLTALAAWIVRAAIPEFAGSNLDTILVWELQSATIAIASIELLRRRIALYWKLAWLAAFGLAGSLLLNLTIDWVDAYAANIVQVTILGMALTAWHFSKPAQPLITDDPFTLPIDNTLTK